MTTPPRAEPLDTLLAEAPPPPPRTPVGVAVHGLSPADAATPTAAFFARFPFEPGALDPDRMTPGEFFDFL